MVNTLEMTYIIIGAIIELKILEQVRRLILSKNPIWIVFTSV